ncbi:MAG: 3-deoxy-7-phosphoheptulonate synthase [Deltaproteobacteria bacterium]|nr:3-deoxy-7-phosphoheptulonate synthase [Deltaproteobacteria bacterium]
MSALLISLIEGADAKRVQGELARLGLWSSASPGPRHTVLQVEAHSAHAGPETIAFIAALEEVAEVHHAASPHPALDAMPRVLEVGRVTFGARRPPVLLAGPCSIESEARIHEVARELGTQGVGLLRGGAFKPRTSPYAFQGHGERALKWIREAANEHGLGVVTEAMAPEEVPVVAFFADLVQIGTRNMHNFPLLKAAGEARKPVLLKRGLAATIEEWLLAAEYLLHHGAPGVIFCERGIRGFEPSQRFTLDLGAVALLSEVHGLPVVVDPSHAAGRRDLIAPLARAGLAAGAAGLLLETHPDPAHARSDGPQAVPLDRFGALAAAVMPRHEPDARRAAGGAA